MFGRSARDTIKKLSTLVELSTLLNSTLNQREVRKKAMEAVTQLLDCKTSSLLLLDEEKEELYFEVALGKKGEKVKQIRLKMGEGIAGWVAKTQESLIIHDVAKDSRHFSKADSQSNFITRNMIAVPVNSKGRLIGVLEAINKLGGKPFYKQDQKILEMLANQVGIAMENARLYEIVSETFLESAEANKLLGLTFQSKGMLELAYERFQKVPLDLDMIEILYNLAFDCERKRMFELAQMIYQKIAQRKSGFKDTEERIKWLSVTLAIGKGERRQSEKPLNKGADNGHAKIGRYEILGELSRGTLIDVYKGRDPRINRQVAIKVLRYPKGIKEDKRNAIRDLFINQAEAAGRLIHPNIALVYDIGDDWDLCYLAMEFLNGKPLTDWCRKDNMLELDTVLNIAIEICEALSYAHTHDVLHLSMRPSNVFLLKDNRVKVTDFGFSSILEAAGFIPNSKMGIHPSAYYTSPEQIRGEAEDERSDIFSFGVVLYEILTGQKPFQGKNEADLKEQIMLQLPSPPVEIRPSIPLHLSKIVEKAILRQTDRRFQTASELVSYLKQIASAMASNSGENHARAHDGAI
jgi:putative methionine-R-sulfoxide reductase with GAF domain